MTTTRDYPRIVAAPPGPKAKAIIDRDEAWTSTSYIKEYPLVIAGGRGAMVQDVDGNQFLDFMAGIAVSATGYNHPKVVAAIKDQADRFLHICGTDFYFEGFAQLAERLARLAPGTSRKRVFLTNSGTEAVEGAIKLARYHTRRPALIAFHGSFHGRTYGAMSLTSSKTKQRRHFGPFLPEVYHVPFCNPYRGPEGATDLENIESVIASIEEGLMGRQVAPDDVAAIFVEPIQGEGGYVIPPMGFLKALRQLCDRHGILLVADEVQSGVGRTGKMWACDWEEVEPDILVTAKGLGSGHADRRLHRAGVGDDLGVRQPRLHLRRQSGELRRGAGHPGRGGAVPPPHQGHGRADHGPRPEADGPSRRHRRRAGPGTHDRDGVRQGSPLEGALSGADRAGHRCAPSRRDCYCSAAARVRSASPRRWCWTSTTWIPGWGFWRSAWERKTRSAFENQAERAPAKPVPSLLYPCTTLLGNARH